MLVSYLIDFSLILITLYIIGFILCYAKVLRLQRDGYSEMTCKDCLNPKKWLSFVLGFILKTIIPQHILEQYVLRLYDEECRRECYLSENGKCVECGCDAIAKALSPMEKCSRGNWGNIIFSKKDYKKHRDQYPVKISIKYGK